MPYLTLYVDDEPVAESIFELPERDKALSREAVHRINKVFLSNKIEELKIDNKTRITQAGSEYSIQFSLVSSMTDKAEEGTGDKVNVKLGPAGLFLQ